MDDYVSMKLCKEYGMSMIFHVFPRFTDTVSNLNARRELGMVGAPPAPEHGNLRGPQILSMLVWNPNTMVKIC
jgi:hypothetical protein